MKGKAFVKVSRKSKAPELNAALEKLRRTEVYVGIASGSKGDARKDKGPDNHLLGYVHEFGSPAQNIPARPFLRPGVAGAKEIVSSGFAAAMKAALADNEPAMTAALERTGMRVVSQVKKYMQTADFVPLSPEYLKHRNRSRLTKSKRANELKGVKVRPLINTGALRNALDFYVKE